MEIPRGRGVLKAKFLEEMYDNKLEFPRGMGVQNKKPSVVGVWINCTLCKCDLVEATSKLQFLPSRYC